MVGRILLIVAAVVVAAVGALLVLLYADRADDRAIARLEPLDVLVVISAVPAGTTVAAAQEAGAFDLREIPRSAVVPGALTELTAVADQLVVVELFEGEQLSSLKLGVVEDLTALQPAAGNLAASFLFADPNRVAGFVTPGAEVVVFTTTTTPDGRPNTRVVLERVSVLAVGSATSAEDLGAAGAAESNVALLTLSLDQRQAEQMILAQSLGELYLGLLDEDSAVTRDGGSTDTDLFEAVP